MVDIALFDRLQQGGAPQLKVCLQVPLTSSIYLPLKRNEGRHKPT